MKTIYIPNTSTAAHLAVRPGQVLAQITKETGLPARCSTRPFERRCDGERHVVRVVELEGAITNEQQLKAISNYPFSGIAYWWEHDDGTIARQPANEREYELRRDSAHDAVLFFNNLLDLLGLARWAP